MNLVQANNLGSFSFVSTVKAGVRLYSYLVFSLKTAVFGCLTNAIASPLIALESCSVAQTDWPVFWSALEKNCLVGGEDFLSDVINAVVLGSFWLMFPGLGPKCFAEVFIGS